MKNYLKYILISVLFAVPLVSFAAEFRSGDQAFIQQTEVIVNDVYIAGGSVNSAGAINGDLITAGGSIIISGDVSNDVMAAGGNVSILANIGDDLRVGGGTVIVHGQVGGDVMIGGGQITLGGSGVGGDVVIAGGSVRIDAPISGNLIVGGGDVYINAPVSGDVKIDADKVTLGSNAVIDGNITYKAKNELTKENGAVINGEVGFTSRASGHKNVTPWAFAAIFSGFVVWKFFALLACAFLVGLILRRYSLEIVNLARNRTLFNMGRGLLVLIVVPIVSILLFISMVGIPFGVLGILGYISLILFAWIVGPIILGSFVYSYFSKSELEVSWQTILVGVVLFSVFGLIPIIGWVINFLFILISLGAIIELKLRIMKEWR